MNGTVEELEKILSLPDADEKPVEDTKTEEEWLPTCQCIVKWETENARYCGLDAVVNMILVCPFCGAGKHAYCEDHKTKAIEGELVCVRCSTKAKTSILLRPVFAVWKSSDE